jgi:hypothetical protein
MEELLSILLKKQENEASKPNFSGPHAPQAVFI